MILEIKRYPEYLEATPGELWLDDVIIGFTLERVWKENAHFISCIPLGTYPLSITMSHRFNTPLPLVTVPGRDGIRIHKANWAHELVGCIAPVSKLTIMDRQLFGSNSGATLDNVMRFIKVHQINELKVSEINKENV